jgi:hypothetical protein
VDESNWTPEYADVREDRVVLYGGLDTGVSKFVYRIKANAKGRFSVPPADVRSLYNPNIQARSGTLSLEVIEPKR